MRYLLLFALLMAACDSNEPDGFDVSGEWTSDLRRQPIAGDCCYVKIVLQEDDGTITGSGELWVPGDRIGVVIKYPVVITGTLSGSDVSMVLTSGSSFATITAREHDEEFYRMKGSIVGFGHSATGMLFW